MNKTLTIFKAVSMAVILFATVFILNSVQASQNNGQLQATTVRNPASATPVSTPTNTPVPIITPVPARAEAIKIPTIPTGKYRYTLTVPKIGVDAPVVVTGLTSDGKMDVPANYKEIGIFGHSVMPGEKGSAVMGAHVDNGSAVAGVFKNLKNLAVGDKILVTDKDGKVLHYKVTKVEILDKDFRDTNRIFKLNDGKSHLNLITCHGTWLPGLNTYSHRLIVYSELVS